METTVNTNRLAIVSLVSGLITLISLAAFYPLFFPAYPGAWPEPTSLISILMDLSRSVREIGSWVALITGILALREIKRKAGTEKGKSPAWFGIILGGG